MALLEPSPAEPNNVARIVGNKTHIEANFPVGIATRANELDDFIEYIIYRDGNELARTADIDYTDALPGYGSYNYSVTSFYDEEETNPSNTVEVEWIENVVDSENPAGVPTDWSIASIYPNPFNPSTVAVIGLPDAAHLQVSVFNIMGQKITTLADGNFTQGYHSFTFDASGLSSGVYFIRAIVPGKMDELKKIVMMK
jgi:hypothetical protein